MFEGKTFSASFAVPAPSSSASMYAAVWLPRFQLQAALRAESLPLRGLFAVLDSDLQATSVEEAEKTGRVLHATPQAERAGVVPGMTSSQAQARCTGLRLLHRLPEEETRAHADLLRCASHWTPHYESTAPGLCVLEVSRVRDMRGRLEACGANMRQWLAQCGLQARIGFAANLDFACLAARATEGVLVLSPESTGSETALLRQLPLSVLQPSPMLAEILYLWGLHTLADLSALPRQEVAARLGPEGLLLWDVAAGGRKRLLRLVRPDSPFRERLELEHPVESLEPLLFLLRRMLDALCARLAGEWLVAAEERITLQFENDQVHTRVIQLAEPTRHADLLLRVLHTHLESVTASAPICAVTVELTPAPPEARQGQLFQRSLRNPNRFAETLGQLEALLGAGNVGRPVLLPSRRRDAFVLRNYLDAPLSPTREEAPSSDSFTHGLPLRWYRPPRLVTVRLLRGHPAAMQTSEGWIDIHRRNPSFLLSGDWWDRHAWRREVWEVAASDGALYQIAREKQGWVLDGIFG